MPDDLYQPELLPAIDLRDGAVVRLYQGDYDRQTTYGRDPVAQAGSFEAGGARWLHVVDLDGAREGEPKHLEVVRAICDATELKVEVGGGVRDRDTIAALLDAGVERVVLGTAAVRDLKWFEALLDEGLAQRLVLGLDARSGQVAVAGWEQSTDLTPFGLAERYRGSGLAAIVYTDIATDGTLEGPSLTATGRMCQSTDVPIVASGGVGTLEDLRTLRGLPVQGVIVGRALYDGRFDVPQALHALGHGERTTQPNRAEGVTRG